MGPVSLRQIQEAAAVIRGVAVRTPLTACPWATRAGPPTGLWLKPENRQPIGAFKLRGAHYAMSRIPEHQRAKGVITHSSGNHGQAVGYAARALGIPATVVMPEGSVPLKVERVRALGAEVVIVPAAERLATTLRLATERGLSVIPPYDHPDVIAGQGTVGLEILDDLPDVDVVLAPVGGGGLISGIAVAVKALRPDIQVIGVEPELAADARDSLRAGRLVPWRVEDRGRTIADGLRVSLSELTLAHITALVDDIVTVSDDEIRSAVVTLARRADIVAEPSGAATTAAYLHRRAEIPAGKVAAVVSGGNIDPALLRELLAG
ncbi:MAG TPA: threonine/serine dehydratase [Micromonosporaceae bacterium]